MRLRNHLLKHRFFNPQERPLQIELQLHPVNPLHIHLPRKYLELEQPLAGLQLHHLQTPVLNTNPKPPWSTPDARSPPKTTPELSYSSPRSAGISASPYRKCAAPLRRCSRTAALSSPCGHSRISNGSPGSQSSHMRFKTYNYNCNYKFKITSFICPHTRSEVLSLWNTPYYP